jgi:hypothetical protein
LAGLVIGGYLIQGRYLYATFTISQGWLPALKPFPERLERHAANA